MAFQFFPRLSVQHKILRFVSTLFKACIFLPLPLLCQSRTVSSVKIPFAFGAGDHAMPAGDYFLSRVSDHIYALSRPDGRVKESFVVFDSFIAAPPQDDKLVFWNFDGHYFLTSFWTGGSQRGFQVRSGRAEQEMLAITQPMAPVATLVALDMRDPRAR